MNVLKKFYDKVPSTPEHDRLLSKWHGDLSQLFPDSELRIAGEREHVKDTIIVGYSIEYDITPRITLSKFGFKFEVEHMGHTIFSKYTSSDFDEAFKAYYIYLSSLYDFCEMQSNRSSVWPKLTVSDNRVETINEIFQ
jgi:hypothetical protein